MKSKVTQENYTYHLNRFISFYHLKDYDSIVSMDYKQLQIMLEDYVMYLKNKVSPNTISSYLSPMELFTDVNEISINWKKIRRLYPQKIKSSGKKAYSTKDIKKMLDTTMTTRDKLLIHVFASTWCRKGAIPDLRIKHLKKMNDDCYCIMFYENSTEEYHSFLTPESSKVLDQYLQERKSNGEILNDSIVQFLELIIR